jgi:colicin import membrane protein
MTGAVRENSWPVAVSVALHGALAGVLVFMAYQSRNRHLPTLEPLPIDAVVVDSKVLHAAQQARADQEAALARAAAAAQAEEARAAAPPPASEPPAPAKPAEPVPQVAAAAEPADTRKIEAAKQAIADAKRAAAAREAAEAKLAEEARAAAEAQAAARKAAEAKAAADAQAAAEARRAADERAKHDREAELRRQLADEEHVSAVEAGPLRDRYITMLRNRIQSAWIKPPSATAGVDCIVEVTQVPGGEVTGARVTQCNGDAAVRQSIENAVYRASPLPDPPDPALFERNLSLRFRPNE